MNAAVQPVSCVLSVLVLLWSGDILVSAAAIDIDTTVISHGNDVPRLKTLDELINSRMSKPQNSKIARITYDDEDSLMRSNEVAWRHTPSSPSYSASLDVYTSEEKRKEEIGKAIQFMRFIGNVDDFLASKAKELLRGMHTMIEGKANIGQLFNGEPKENQDHDRYARTWSDSADLMADLVAERSPWTKRDVGKPDSDLQAKRIQDLEKAKKFMQIVGQVDAYVSDRAKTLLKSLHNIIDHRQAAPPSGFTNHL